MSRNQTGLILFLFPRAKQAFRDKVEKCLNVQDESTEQFREDVREAVNDLRTLIYDRTVAGPSLESMAMSRPAMRTRWTVNRSWPVSRVSSCQSDGMLVTSCDKLYGGILPRNINYFNNDVEEIDFYPDRTSVPAR